MNQQRDAQFKEKNKLWPRSNHYIYIKPETIDSTKDGITAGWFMEQVFQPILDEIEMTDQEKVKNMWIMKQRSVIKDLFQQKMELMMKTDESDCEVSDSEAEKFLKQRSLENKKASRKLSTTDLKELKKVKVKLKKDKK